MSCDRCVLQSHLMVFTSNSYLPVNVDDPAPFTKPNAFIEAASLPAASSAAAAAAARSQLQVLQWSWSCCCGQWWSRPSDDHRGRSVNGLCNEVITRQLIFTNASIEIFKKKNAKKTNYLAEGVVSSERGTTSWPASKSEKSSNWNRNKKSNKTHVHPRYPCWSPSHPSRALPLPANIVRIES